jgi:hypothetical protein
MDRINPKEGGTPASEERSENRLRLVSHFPGRLRVRAEMFRVLPDVAEAVSQRMREEPGVGRVDVSPRTGSLVIEYEPRVIQLPRVVDLLVRTGGLHGLEVDIGAERADRERPGIKIREVMDLWDRFIAKVSDGRIDLRTGVPATLLAFGAGVILFGKRRMPEWYDFIFWSFVTFINLNPGKNPWAPGQPVVAHPAGDRGHRTSP